MSEPVDLDGPAGDTAPPQAPAAERTRSLLDRTSRHLALLPLLVLVAAAAVSQWMGPAAVVRLAVLGAAMLLVAAMGDLVPSRRAQLLVSVATVLAALAAVAVLSRPPVREALDGGVAAAIRPAPKSSVPGDQRGRRPSESDLRPADLAGVRWDGAVLDGVDLTDKRLDGASMRGASARGAVLRRASLRDAQLQGADLSGADLTGACLRDADLGSADLRGVRLDRADLVGAALPGDVRTTALGLPAGPPAPTGACTP